MNRLNNPVDEFVSSPFPKYHEGLKCTQGNVYFVTVFQMDDVKLYGKYGRNEKVKKIVKDFYQWKYKDRGGLVMNKRTWGVVSSLEEADYIVMKNMTDIHECSYTYAVVEEIPFGVIAMHKRQWFYKWNEKKQSYIRLKKCPKNIQKWWDCYLPQFVDIG